MKAVNISYVKSVVKAAGPGYWYLATPYSNYPKGREAAFDDARLMAATLIAAGVHVFCPIAHSHPIGETGLVANTYEVWLGEDEPLMEGAVGMIVVMMEGWKESRGVSYEVNYALKHGKPIVFLQVENGNE